MPESPKQPSETATPHVVYASTYPRRPWRETWPTPRPIKEQIRDIRETLKRAG